MSAEKEIDNSGLNDSDDSDESEDEDYVPSEHEVSEEDKSGDEDDFVPSDSEQVSLGKGKRKKTTAKKSKPDSNPRLARNKQSQPDEQNLEFKKQIEQEQAANKEQKEKQRADALWANFMSDVTPTAKAKPNSSSGTSSQNKPQSSQGNKSANVSGKPAATVKVTKVFDFAGETVRLEKEVKADSKEAKQSDGTAESPATSGKKRVGGLGAVLGFINKKTKISTLDKSKLDWENYKKASGLQDELKSHTNSKNSYLDKKEFLERSDHRQFEKERDMRLASSSRR